MRAATVFLVAAACVTSRGRGADVPGDEAARVILVANASDPASVALARFYARERMLPAANLVALPMSSAETITWEVFTRELFNPLQAWLVERAWIDASPGTLTDAYGRTRIAPSGHRIAYLVLFRGVPLRIAHDPARMPPAVAARIQDRLRTNQASVDSELALLAAIAPDINGPAANPLYKVRQPGALVAESVVRVARIDGPTASACEGMIHSALEGERRGVAGRAYIDLGGPHPSGDEWLRATAQALRALDFDVDEHGDKAVMPATARFDAPVFYFGWYAGDANGPFRAPGFRFPPGAVALHIHSFSARTLRSATEGWCGPLVGLGVAATVGNVFEPYLELTHHPDLFFESLAGGATLGEAAYYALPAMSWQGIVLGDPLYRPFARSLDEQLEDLDQRDDALAAYVALREFNRRRRESPEAESVAWLEKTAREHPALVLSFRLAEEKARRGDRAGAEAALLASESLRKPRFTQFALVAAAAEVLAGIEAHAAAVTVFGVLLDAPAIGDEWRRHLLPKAIEQARLAGDAERLAAWEATHSMLERKL